jgi:dihydropteroate synthase
MHNRGTPETMIGHARYYDVVAEVRAELGLRIDAALQAGIRQEHIVIDPGIGFAKTGEHSLILLRHLRALGPADLPVLVGVSRKRFVGALSKEPDPAWRLGGSLAAGLFALSRGAAILRVHDVRETVHAIRVWSACNQE